MNITGKISGSGTLAGGIKGRANMSAVSQATSIIHATDYDKLANKPQIESVTLQGNKSLEDIGILKITNAELAELLV